MSAQWVRVGGFEVERCGQSLVIATPAGRTEVAATPFLRATNHLLAMGLDLEGKAELEGGLTFQARGELVRLKLGDHSETLPRMAVEQFFRDLAGT